MFTRLNFLRKYQILFALVKISFQPFFCKSCQNRCISYVVHSKELPFLYQFSCLKKPF